MSIATQTDRGYGATAQTVLVAVFALGVVGALILPRGTPVWLLLLTLAGLGFQVYHEGQSSDRRGAPLIRSALPLSGDWLTWSLLLFGGYCAINSLWSAAPLASLGKVGWLLLVVLAANLLIQIWSRLDPDTAGLLLRMLIVGFAVGAIFVLIEVLSQQSITRAFYNTLEFMRPQLRKHMQIEAGEVVRVFPYVTNRNVGAMHLLLWPTLLAIAVWRGGGRLKVLANSPALLIPAGALSLLAAATLLQDLPLKGLIATFAAFALASVAFWHSMSRSGWLSASALLLLVLVATMPSEHESSQIAILLSAGIFALCTFAPTLGHRAVAAGWMAALLGVVPAVMLANSAGLDKNVSLPLSARARIELWHYSATEIVKHPVRGIGVDATRFIDEQVKPSARKAGQIFGDRPGQHSHNVYMQAWLELGAIGVVLLLAAGLMLWRAILRLPAPAQPFAMAAFTSAMVIGAFTWGLWQEWYLGLFGLSLALTALGAPFAQAAVRAHRKA